MLDHPPQSDELIALALAEDLGVAPARFLHSGYGGGIVGSSLAASEHLLAFDVTSDAVIDSGDRFTGTIRARQQGVVCGLQIASRVFEMLSGALQATDEVAGHGRVTDSSAQDVEFFPLVAEGTDVSPGLAVAEVEGPTRVVLAGERSALNLLMTLSGIATEARRWQHEAGDELHVVDTRKTLPGLRALSKYAVRVGGAYNHRAGLHDMALIKDNHLARAESIAWAVSAVRRKSPALLIEVEADTVEQALEATAAGADLVLLDNMDDTTMTVAVQAIRAASRAAGTGILIEASGSIAFARLAALREIGVDRVSSSRITLAPPLDFGLDEGGPS